MTAVAPVMRKPSPAWDPVEVGWYGTTTIGDPAEGTLSFQRVERIPGLDVTAARPVGVYNTKDPIVVRLGRELLDFGDGTTRYVGAARVPLPAIDADIANSDVLWRCDVDLTNADGADPIFFRPDPAAAAGGTYWLNLLQAYAGATQSRPNPEVTRAEFKQLEVRVAGAGPAAPAAPLPHAASHAAGGEDPVTVHVSQLSGTIPPARLGTGATGGGTLTLRDNGTWAAPSTPPATVATAAPGARFTVLWDAATSSWTYNGTSLTDRPSPRTDVYFDMVGAPSATSGGPADPDWMLSGDVRRGGSGDSGTPGTVDTTGLVPTSRVLSAGTGLSGGGALTNDVTLAVKYGATAGTAAQGDDSRLSDARTPKAHAATHASGGSDPITVTGEQISGTIPADRLGAGAADQTTVLWGDRTWRPPPAASTMQYNPTQAQIDAMPVGTYYVTSP